MSRSSEDVLLQVPHVKYKKERLGFQQYLIIRNIRISGLTESVACAGFRVRKCTYSYTKISSSLFSTSNSRLLGLRILLPISASIPVAGATHY